MILNDLKVSIAPASIDDYPTIQNMARFYVYDMSQYMGNEEEWKIPKNGLYECIDFKKYWTTKNSYPHLILYEKELAGFVIVDGKGVDEKAEYNMAQFFILRKFINKGLGKYVAKTCFENYKGIWDVMVIPKNIGAYRFWKSVIKECTNDTYTEHRTHIKHLNNCERIVFRFSSNFV